MKILVIGMDTSLQECRAKFGDQHHYALVADQQNGEKLFAEHDVIFDFNIAAFPKQVETYRNHPNVPALLNTTLASLKQLGTDEKLPALVFGFC